MNARRLRKMHPLQANKLELFSSLGFIATLKD